MKLITKTQKSLAPTLKVPSPLSPGKYYVEVSTKLPFFKVVFADGYEQGKAKDSHSLGKPLEWKLHYREDKGYKAYNNLVPNSSF